MSRFVKGQSGNPNGRPKGSVSLFSKSLFLKVVKEVEKEKRKSIYKHFIERAYEDDRVLVCLMTRLIPQAKTEEIDFDHVDEEIGFPDVPMNGEGQNRFKEYLN